MCVKIAANGAGLSGRFSVPGARVEMFDKNLVNALVGGKDLDCGSAELRVNVVLTRDHGSLLLDPSYFRACHPEVMHFNRQAEPDRTEERLSGQLGTKTHNSNSNQFNCDKSLDK
jgi:hypothetical protein